jgi:hypothetical protein
MTHTFKPGDRVMLCPVVESVDGDTVKIVTWDGQHVNVWSQFLQPAPAPAVDLIPEILNVEGMWRLINHGRVG